MRDGTRHPLYRAVRLELLLLSLVGLAVGIRHLAATVEEVRHAGHLALPEDDAAFRQTLVGALAEAVVTFDFDGGIRAALAEEDFQKAETLHGVAGAFGIRLADDVERDYALATSGWAVLGRNAVDFARGSLTGYGEGAFGLAGAIGTDLVVPLYGDVRDAGIQLWRYAHAQEVDGVILGLAAIGLALPVMQAATDPLKAALRLGRTSPKLTQGLRNLTEQAVDTPGLTAWLRRSNADEAAGAARFVRRQGVEAIGRAGGDVAGIFASGGRRATAAALRTADTVEDLTVFRRIARTFGAEADGYITLVGRRTGMMYRTWRLTAPLAVKLLALGSLLSMAGVLLAASLSHAAGSRLVRIVGLRWLARMLASP